MSRTARENYAHLRRTGPKTPRSPLEHALNIGIDEEHENLQSEWNSWQNDYRVASQPGRLREKSAIKVQTTTAGSDVVSSEMGHTRVRTDKERSLNSVSINKRNNAWISSHAPSSSQDESYPQTVDFENTLIRLGDEQKFRA